MILKDVISNCMFLLWLFDLTLLSVVIYLMRKVGSRKRAKDILCK